MNEDKKKLIDCLKKLGHPKAAEVFWEGLQESTGTPMFWLGELSQEIIHAAAACGYVEYRSNGTWATVPRGQEIGDHMVIRIKEAAPFPLAAEDKDMEASKDGQPLNLYVWPSFVPDSTHGLAFAIAPSEAEAMRLVATHYQYATGDWGPVRIFDLDQPIAFAVLYGS